MKTLCLVLPAIVLACLMLAGCGQKGPLFLPGQATASQADGAFGHGSDNGAGDEVGQSQSSPLPAHGRSNANGQHGNANPDRSPSPVGTP